jgi:hypothetical protein
VSARLVVDPVLTLDTLRDLVALAVYAPSSHNTQPWRFRLAPASIDLLADRTRALPVNDPFDRELVISCGAALMALRVAAAAKGLAADVRLLPDPADHDVLARVVVGRGAVEPGLADLAAHLLARRTYRKAFDPHAVPEETMAALGAAAALEGGDLRVLDGDQRKLAGELVAEGDHHLWNDPRWRRELAMWMHPRRDGDGLAVPALVAPVAQAVVRTFDMGDGLAAKDQQLLLGSPSLTVLATEEDDPRAWLHAGQALQRALLEGCRRGLQASYLNQPIEVPALRQRLREALGTPGHPQVLLRWGHPAGPVAPTPRRPVDAVIDVAEA